MIVIPSAGIAFEGRDKEGPDIMKPNTHQPKATESKPAVEPEFESPDSSVRSDVSGGDKAATPN